MSRTPQDRPPFTPLEPAPPQDLTDPLAALRMQGRAQAVFARAARMQDLHGQAQAVAFAQQQDAVLQAYGPNHAPDASAAAMVEQSARTDLGRAHRALQQASRAAAGMAQVDEQIAQLNALIHGSAAAGGLAADARLVVDVQATEVPGPGPAPAVAEPVTGLPPATPRLPRA